MEVEIWLVERDGSRIAPLTKSMNFDFFEWELNRAGSASISGSPLARNVSRIEGVRNEIQIWIDGTLYWQGPVWGLTGDPSTISVNCQGIYSLFKKRFIDRTSLVYASIDQFQIAANLITYAQDESVELYRDFLIDFASFTPSGVPRSREYKLDDHACILDLLNEFDGRTLKNGFDWDIDISGGGGSRFWTPYYPKKGSTKTNHTVEFDAEGGQRNISSFTWTEDFEGLGTKVIVTGGSVTTDSVTFRKYATHEVESASEYWGQMQIVTSDGDQLDQDWLEDRAEQEAIRHSTPSLITEITSARMLHRDALGEVWVGDYIPVKIDYGRIQVDALHRVERMRLNGDSTISFGFGEVIEA